MENLILATMGHEHIIGHRQILYGEDIAVAIGSFAIILNSIMFLVNHRRWSAFFTAITDFEEFGEPPGFDKVRKMANSLSSVIVWYITIGSCIYEGVSILHSACEDDSLCGTFTPIWLPLGPRSVTMKVTITVIQMATSFFHLIPAAIIFFICAEACELLITHMDHLKSKFERAFLNNDQTSMRESFNDCIRYHIEIIRLADQLNSLVRKTVTLAALACAIVVGCIGNQVESSPGAFTYLLGYVGTLFVLCRAGQRIKDESSAVEETVFGTNWYESDVRIWKDIKLVIARCQRPLVLDCIPLGTFGYPLYATIIKTSYSYMTVLRQNQ